MLNFVSNKIVTLIYKIIGIFSHVKIDLSSNISPRILLSKSKGIVGSKRNPIIIKNSYISNIRADEGCRIENAICSGNIKLGRFVSINGPSTRVSSRIYGIEIGSFTSIASNVVIQEDYHRTDRPTSYFIFKNIFQDSISKDIYSKGPIIIEEDVWIGSNSVILSGIKIGRGSVIGAGSIVTKDIPRYSIVVGNPAKVIKSRFSNEVIEALENSKWWEKDINGLVGIKDIFSKDLTDPKNEKAIKMLLMQ